MIRKNITLSIIILFALTIYIITALNSHGYYYADEHYQIIEFAGLKLGINSPDDLAWEYKAQIRPSVQPAIGYILIKICMELNITNPYSQAFILRLISTLLTLFSVTFFLFRTKHRFELITDKTLYFLLSFFLWFIPVIGSRFSSETWSGLLFLLALGMFFSEQEKKSNVYITGFLLGLSFVFRFQMAFATLGLVLWLLFFNKLNFKYILQLFSAFLAAVLFGSLIDYWFYGEFVFTPWNYFMSVLETGPIDFESFPWYYYIIKLITYPTVFIGFPIVISIILLLIFKPKNFLLWIILPFIFIHSLVAHKEERFMFPIVFLLPILLTDAYVLLKEKITNRLIFRILNYLLLAVFISVNAVGLYAGVSKSAGIGRMEITKYIHDNYGNKKIQLIYCWWANPYNPWHDLPAKFYREKNLTDIRIDDLCSLNDSLIKNEAETVNLLIIRKKDLSVKDCRKNLKKYKFFFEIQSIPKWIEKINKYYLGFENDDILELYRYSNYIR